MEPLPNLNRAAPRRIGPSVLLALLVALSVGLLHGRLAVLYTRPAAIPAPPARPPMDGPAEAFTIPGGGGFHLIALRRGQLLARGPDRLIGQQDVSLCDQWTGPSTDTGLPPLHVGWDWAQLRAAAAVNLAARPPRPANQGLKNPLLDDGPGGVDVPAFEITLQPAGAPLRPAVEDQPLLLTLRDRWPVLMLADTAETGTGPALAFRRDLWLLWNAGAATAERWNHAARVRRLADRDCPFGRLQVGVYGPPESNESGTDPGPRVVLWYSGQEPAREFRLAPGRYDAPPAPSPRREDAVLFERALAVGLLRAGEDGRIAVAPADLPLRQIYARARPELLTPRGGEPDWLKGSWDDGIRQTHRALHFSASGRYVRQQVEAFNARQLLAAVRWKSEHGLAGDWRADWAGAPLALTAAMPLLAGRLFPEAPRDWQPWRRVARWPALAGRPPVRFHLTLARPARRGERLELLVVGGAPTVTSATVLANEPRGLDDRSGIEPTASTPRLGEGRNQNPSQDGMAHWLRLELHEGATELALSFPPLPATAFPDLYRYDFAHIQREDGRLVWCAAPAGPGVDPTRPPPAEVTLRDRAGGVLLERGQPTEAAWSLGLAALVGLEPAQADAVGGVLARLGTRGMAAVDARLTVDARMQAAARRALVERLPQVAAAFGAADPWREMRVASLVVMDADRGDILAVANSPEPSPGAIWSDLYSFAVGQPRRNPLRIWAWQHDGGGRNPAGSVFELVDALLLEREAGHRPELAAVLVGLTAEELTRSSLARTYDFGLDATCYPAHARGCEARARRPGTRHDRSEGVAMPNFRNAAGVETSPERMWRYRGERYGLAQALRDSLNTWFAWLVETTDATLLDDPRAPGLADARALTPAALREARPLLDLAATLGFGAGTNLDGGLLPPDLIETGDALRTTASTLDPITSRAQVRLAALGFRMQVTPLQLAEVAAAIATGRWVTPRLLLELNGRPAVEPASRELGIPTDRIRDGMKRGATDGTARVAFAGPGFDAFRPYLRVKTGTADLGETGTARNAWLVGWLEPGALPGENRRLAFTCLISHTAGTGDEECGPLVATWLAALREAGGEP